MPYTLQNTRFRISRWSRGKSGRSRCSPISIASAAAIRIVWYGSVDPESVIAKTQYKHTPMTQVCH